MDWDVLNDSGSMNDPGECLEFGRFVCRDISRACNYYKLGAEKGHCGATANFGFCLQHGLGIEANAEASVRYYEKSIAGGGEGNAFGMNQYALCLQYSIVFDENLEDAALFYVLVAEGRGDERYLLENSFRCQRGLQKARMKIRGSRGASDTGNVRDMYLDRTRELGASELAVDYVVEKVGSLAGREIGRGGCSVVKVGRDLKTGKGIAVKCFVCSDLEMQYIFIREVEVLAKLNHPCVVRLVGWILPEVSGYSELHTELAERGSLGDVLEDVRSGCEGTFWNETRICIIICDIVLGMRFVHSREIIHLDLKPSNILINAAGRALIGDFGSSRFGQGDGTGNGHHGTVHYSAPELFEEPVEYSSKADVFSFGFILYEIMTGRPVFDSSLLGFPVIRKLRNGERPDIPEGCGEFMGSLIRRCWSDDPSFRPTFDDILREFQSRNFCILPNANGCVISDTVIEVLRWESRS
jgi:hypothetical protein